MIKKGTKVKVLTGKDKNKDGEVIEIDRQNNRAKVKGINIIKKHVKTTKEKKGGIISKENFLHISNLTAVESKDTDSSLLTNDTLNKSYECGCGSSHIFNKDTFIVWRRILGSAFVLADRNCNFANFVEQKGFFKIKMNTIYMILSIIIKN